MGGTVSMPPPDAHVVRTMKCSKIKLKYLKRHFWKPFRKMDKNLSGTIDIAEFYKFLEEPRSIFGDAMFELNDCNQSGTLEFSEYFQTVVTYCLFEQEEIMRYCFYILDRDKNGYIEKDELLMMVNILYGISPDEKPKGNTRVAVQLLEFNPDGKVDFAEFKAFHKLFPALFYPAFRLQVQMRIKIAGEWFWQGLKQKHQKVKEGQRAKENYVKAKEMARQLKLQQKKIRKKMGCCRYYLCPLEAEALKDDFPITLAAEESEADKKRKLAEGRMKMRQAAEAAAANPETDEWKLYLARKTKLRYRDEARASYMKKLKPKRVRTVATERDDRRAKRRAKDRRLSSNSH